MISLRSSRLLLALSLLTGAGCGGNDLTLPPSDQSTQIQAVQGDEQIGLPSSRLADPLVVRLLDQAGNGIANRTVLWVIKSGGGAIIPATGMTDAEGYASAEWTLGPTPGPNVVDAQVPEVGIVTFTSMASPDGDDGGIAAPSGSRSRISAEPATIPAGTGTSTIIVTVLDQSGNPVEGATVELQATGGGNTLTQPSGNTGSDGVASGALRSTTPGEKVVSATVDGSVALSQTATVMVTGTSPVRIELVEGDHQSVPAGTPVPIRPAVRVVDERGDPVAGVEVTVVITGGGGSVEGAGQTTDADGVARVGSWTLGSAGANSVEARAGSLQGSPVVFTAEGTVSEAAVDHLEFQLQPPPTMRTNESFRVEVTLVDSLGNVVPLSEIFIYLGLFREGSDTPTNDDLNGERFENTVSGIASFDLRVEKKGRYRLRALTDDLPEHGPNGPTPFLFSRVFEVQ